MTDFDPVSTASDHHSDVMYPTTENNTTLNGHTTAIQSPKGTGVGGAPTAFDAAQSHPLTWSVKETDGNGEAQLLRTSGPDMPILKETSVLPTPNQLLLNPLRLDNRLQWRNPRATLISFITAVITIFAFRYLHIARWILKCLYVVLGTTAAAELVGRLTISHGLTSQFRPMRYYTIPRETVDSIFDELHELLNFFILEFQRILYAENVIHTMAAFASSLLGYWLIKIVPLWGLTLIATSVIFLAPLVYVSNRETIDSQVQSVTDLINKHTAQVKEIAGQHTARATETAKAYASDLSSKAQQYVGSARGRTVSLEAKLSAPKPQPYATITPSKPKTTANNNTSPLVYTAADFPAAPKEDPSSLSDTPAHEGGKPLIAA